MKTYLENVKQTIAYFNEVNDQLFTQIINMAMSGELKEIDSVLTQGEVVTYYFEDFKGVNDANVKIIYQLIEIITAYREQMININDIEDEELPF